MSTNLPAAAATSRGAFAFIESNTSGSGRLFAHTAARLGYWPVMLSANPSRYPYVAADGLHAVLVDTNDPDAVLGACRAIATEVPIAAVTSSSEYFIATSARVARALGLPGPDPEAITACRDKERQRLAFERAGVPSPRFAAASTADDAVRAAERIGLPVVLKPVTGSGSAGVRRCATTDEVRAFAEASLAETTNARGAPIAKRILVEEYAEGVEVSVEVFDGAVVGVTRKHPSALPWFVAVEHDFPADLPAADVAHIGDVARAATRALGLAWGPCHVELTVTSRGPVLIEVNPRLAGALIPELVRLAAGIDLVESTLRAWLGDPRPLTPTCARWAAIRFALRTGEGRLARIDGVAEARAVPGVVAVETTIAPDDSLARFGDFRDRIASVIAVRDTPDELHACIDAAFAHLHVVSTP